MLWSVKDFCSNTSRRSKPCGSRNQFLSAMSFKSFQSSHYLDDYITDFVLLFCSFPHISHIRAIPISLDKKLESDSNFLVNLKLLFQLHCLTMNLAPWLTVKTKFGQTTNILKFWLELCAHLVNAPICNLNTDHLYWKYCSASIKNFSSISLVLMNHCYCCVCKSQLAVVVILNWIDFQLGFFMAALPSAGTNN